MSALLSGGSAARESPLSHTTRAVGLIQLFLDDRAPGRVIIIFFLSSLAHLHTDLLERAAIKGVTSGGQVDLHHELIYLEKNRKSCLHILSYALRKVSPMNQGDCNGPGAKRVRLYHCS